MFGLFKKGVSYDSLPHPRPQNVQQWNEQFLADLGLPPFPEEADREAAEEGRKRRNWVRDRLWHNGSHRDCCPRCFQAGYVLALVRANRLDLLTEHLQLISVYDELARDGMLETAFAKTPR